MPHEKLFTAKEAAQAVLAKAQEMFKSSALAKAPAEKGMAVAEGVKEQPAPNDNPAEIKENGNPAPGAIPQNKEEFGAEKKGLKGHLKLAKFVGRMEEKRKSKAPAAPGAPEMDKAETGHEKGVHTHNHEGQGNSPAGSFSSAAVKGNTSLPKKTLNGAAKDEHKKVLGEMKSMPKPKLPG